VNDKRLVSQPEIAKKSIKLKLSTKLLSLNYVLKNCQNRKCVNLELLLWVSPHLYQLGRSKLLKKCHQTVKIGI